MEAARELEVPVMIGVGGTLGFYTHKKRAPQLLQALRLEWLWRALTEKGHAGRAFQAAVVFPCRAVWWALIRG